jgi:TPR repeat protein
MLTFPVFVPSDMQHVQSLLSKHQIADACAELLRLAQLGSVQAAAALGLLYFRGIRWAGAADTEVLDICRRAAIRGGSYAQYVMALYEGRRGDRSKEWAWLKMSNKQEFGPSLTESARLAANVARNSKLAWIYIKRALKARHLPALMLLVAAGSKGRFGILWRIFGVILCPGAVLMMFIALFYFRYSEHVLASTNLNYELRYFPEGDPEKRSGHEI